MSAPILGVMWEWDHRRLLGWREYQEWMSKPLPMGWAVIAAPECGAEIIDTTAKPRLVQRIKALLPGKAQFPSSDSLPPGKATDRP